jgi:hypothetical protein
MFLQDFSSAMSKLTKRGKGAINMDQKQEKRLAITRELMENAKKRIDLSYELEQDLENLGLQRRMKQLNLEGKLLKKQNNELA